MYRIIGLDLPKGEQSFAISKNQQKYKNINQTPRGRV